MRPVLDEIRRSPRLGEWIDELRAYYAEEQEARRRFLEEVDEGTKAEFINGEIVLHSPARFRHTEAVGRLHTLLNLHVHVHRLGSTGSEKMMISLERNDYEPDVVFFGTEKAAAFVLDQLRFPAPDFVAEVLSDSTEHRDRGIKFEDFAAHGTVEYWIVDPVAERIEQYVLKNGAYERIESEGVVRSVAVRGFEISERALFDSEAFLDAVGRIRPRG